MKSLKLMASLYLLKLVDRCRQLPYVHPSELYCFDMGDLLYKQEYVLSWLRNCYS